MSKLFKTTIVAVVCTDNNDFLKWKHIFLSHLNNPKLGYNTVRKFVFLDKTYIAIHKAIHLCSLAIDDVIYTGDCHNNPEYDQIIELLNCNFNIKELEPEPEVKDKITPADIFRILHEELNDVDCTIDKLLKASNAIYNKL